jgi:hypothetical protein
MDQSKSDSVHLACPSCAGRGFELRVLKDEGLATVQCTKCRRNYLLLDSEDHWFDVIQSGYPRLSRCQCKAFYFGLRCDCRYTESGDVRSIGVWSTCSACDKTRRLMNLEIDYGDTEDLVKRPLRPCNNPKVLYDLQNLTLYVTRDDIARVVGFLGSQHSCAFVCGQRKQGEWTRDSLNGEETKSVTLQGDDLSLSRTRTSRFMR